MRAIPKRVLIHSATLKKPVKDPWGGVTSSADTALKNVRFEPLTARDADLTEGLEKVSAKLFFDCRNSSPAGTVFDTGDKVVFNSVEHNVEKVTSYYDDRRLHHYEIYLN